MWTDSLLRLRALLFRRQMDNELQDELQFHLEMQARKNQQSYLAPRRSESPGHADPCAWPDVWRESSHSVEAGSCARQRSHNPISLFWPR